MRFSRLFAGFFIVLSVAPVLAAQTVRIAVIDDGPLEQFQGIQETFVSEFSALTRGEFNIEFARLSGGWTLSGIDEAFEAAYGDPSIDMVLGLGFIANQVMVSRATFKKPTFLPMVFDAGLVGAPADQATSGKKNLSYLAERVSLVDELASYQRVMPFRHAAVLVDQLILDAIPALRPAVTLAGRSQGLQLTLIAHDGRNHDLFPDLPDDADAVLYTGLPRLPQPDFLRLVGAATASGLPTFSVNDQSAVVNGMLASDTIDTDWRRLARRNALNMQAVLLGGQASEQPVFFEGKQELTINLATARAIGLSPRFDVLSEATLLNVEADAGGPTFNLFSVSRAALERNLGVRVAEISSSLADDSVKIARSSLFPQIGLSASSLKRRETASVSAGLLPEQSVDTSLSLTQQIYSDDSYSNLGIQKFNRDGELAAQQATNLDAVLEASLAYVDALRAENQLKVRSQNLALSKSNLDLARDRVRIGMSSNADVYRWQSNLANARSDVLSAVAQLQQAKEALNRVLDLPLDSPFQLVAAKPRDPFTMSTDDFDRIVTNPRALGWVTDYFVETGISRSPELARLDAQIGAKQREIKNRKRDYWLPDVSLSTQFGDNLSQSGAGSGGPGDGNHDWSVSLNASIGLFSGGRRRSELSRSELELLRLRINRNDTYARIEQQIRATAHNLSSSYSAIALSKEAANAAGQNLALVTDSYARGAVNILELLDAQNESLSADLSASNAVYNFVAAALQMQRAASNFNFLTLPEDTERENRQFMDFIEQREAGLPGRQRGQ